MKYTDLTDKEFFFVANDADEEVVDYLRNNYIPHYVFNNTPEHKGEWYINNVYRAYNFAVQVAKGDFVILINSDMTFTPQWVDALIAAYDGSNCVASRLVESGKLRVGTHGLEKNFGRTIAEFKEDDFQRYAQIVSSPETVDGGLFMPLLVKKDQFEQIGGYPEGNAKASSTDIFHPEIAKLGEELIPGDAILMKKFETIGVRHQTAYNSLVYHFQCGEKDEPNAEAKGADATGIAIVNDLVTGSMGEKVLWDYLIETLPGAYGVDQRRVGKKDFPEKAKEYIRQSEPPAKVIIQNASFIDFIDTDTYTIAFLQDDLRSMGRQSLQQEMNLKLADKIVTNSYQTAAVYREYPCEVISVGLDDTLFSPKDRSALRTKHGFKEKKTGIFVGDFSEVKGWSKVKGCIEKYPDIHWILVTKKNEDYTHPNVTVYKRIDQKLLSELLTCADFFIIGSPVETQCLAAIEACLCDIPVVMPNVGLFKDLTDKEKGSVGIIGEDLGYGVAHITEKTYHPRAVMLSRGLTIRESMEKWRRLIERSLVEAYQNRNTVRKTQEFSGFYFKAELFFRKRILLNIFGSENMQVRRRASGLVAAILRKVGLLEAVKKLLGRS